jgi:hypothetical protein
MVAETIRTRIVDAGLAVVGFTIDGHRDVYATACCGDSLYARLPDIRELVAQPSPPPHHLSKEQPMEPIVTNDGTVYVFVIGTDSAVWERHCAPGGAWTEWATLGGEVRNPV